MAHESLHSPESRQADASTVKKLRASFESELETTRRSSIETWLSKVSSSERESLFRELLQAELAFWQPHGTDSRAEEYLARFPEFADLIQMVFDARTTRSAPGSNDLSVDSTVGPPPLSSRAADWKNWAEGDSVGRYILEKFLGRGGFGEVWKALDPELDRLVAIKLPRKKLLNQADSTSRFRDEARRAASLKDKGIVPVYDIGQAGLEPFIVSELIDGPTLSERMRSGPLTREESARIVAHLARSLHQAHLAGLVHRDMKPSNVLLRPDGTPAITDFGLAISEGEQLSPAEGVVGTITYMSPEQARGEGRRIDGRSDLYSLGVIFYQMLTGRAPFQLGSSSELLDQIIHSEVRPPRSVNDAIPAELERICLRCLEKDVRQRYSTGSDLADDLELWSSPERPISQRRSLIPAALVSFLALVLVLGGAWGLFNYLGGRNRVAAVPPVPPPGQEKPDPPPKDPPQRIPAAPAEERRERVTKRGIWLKLLGEPVEKIAVFKGDATDYLNQDTAKRELTFRSEKNLWALGVGHRGPPPLRIRGSVFVDEWQGAAGFFWGLTNDPDAFPKQRPRCFAILVERPMPRDSLKISLKRLIVGEFTPDVPWINDVRLLEYKELSDELTDYQSLEVIVQESGLEVWLDGKMAWKPEFYEPAMLKEVVAANGAVGLVGQGKSVVFRDVSALFQHLK